MTLPQFRILLLVARSPERANRLASQASISRPSLTGVLDGLVSGSGSAGSTSTATGAA